MEDGSINFSNKDSCTITKPNSPRISTLLIQAHIEDMLSSASSSSHDLYDFYLFTRVKVAVISYRNLTSR